MGDVLVFPGAYGLYETSLEENSGPSVVNVAEDFVRLRSQQRHAEQSSAALKESPAQCRMNRLAAEMLEVKIDRVVQRLQELPADAQEAKHNIHSLFTLADGRPRAMEMLEEVALYTLSAYWDAGFLATSEVAPLLQNRVAAAQVRHNNADGISSTVDMVHAVVTQHVVGCFTDDRLNRLRQIEYYDLLEYFDHPGGPDDVPPAMM